MVGSYLWVRLGQSRTVRHGRGSDAGNVAWKRGGGGRVWEGIVLVGPLTPDQADRDR